MSLGTSASPSATPAARASPIAPQLEPSVDRIDHKHTGLPPMHVNAAERPCTPLYRWFCFHCGVTHLSAAAPRVLCGRPHFGPCDWSYSLGTPQWGGANLPVWGVRVDVKHENTRSIAPPVEIVRA